MPKSILINNAILFLCCSIYLGTGVTIVFFQLPLASQLTPDNYALVFVKPVELATQFFTWMTILMLVTATIMLISEWLSGIRWVPILVLFGVFGATALTVFPIFEINAEMVKGIDDQALLSERIDKWADLSRIRAGLWAVEWLAMMYWFYRVAGQGRADR